MKKLKMIQSLVAILCILLLVSVTVLAQSDNVSATIRIEQEDGIAGFGVYPGQTVEVDILLDRTRMLTSGFELMIGYDQTALTLDTVLPGIELYETCGWEAFGYRKADVISNDNFPTARVQISGRWDMNLPITSPPCVFPDSPLIRIAAMRFTVGHDGLPIGGFLPIQFYWEDCGNNTLGSIDGSTLYMSNVVHDGYGNLITPESSFPTLGGTVEIQDCEIDTARRRTERNVRFYGGGIKIRNLDSSGSLSIRIERENGSGHGVIQGQTVDVDIILDPTDRALGGFDLLIGYDKDELEIDTVFPGAELYDSCGWEFFTYRLGGRGGPIPWQASRLFSVIGFYDFNDGISPPECVLPYDRPSRLATVRFKVANNRTLEGKFLPLNFLWGLCRDNAVSNRLGDTLFFSKHVFDPEGIEYEPPDSLPTLAGAVPYCYREPSPRFIFRSDISFYSGGVEVVNADSVDAPCRIGDLNANLVPFETADALMYIDYVIEGISVFGTHAVCSIEASDVNYDRTPLTLADLQYTLRTIAGDAIWPPPLLSPNIATFRVDPLTGIVTVESPDSIGVIYIEFDEPLDPELLDFRTKIKYQKSDSLTRAIVYSWNKYLEYPEFLKVPPFSRIKNVSAATFNGAQIRTEIAPSFSDTCSPGDINGNGTPYEISDAAMFTNFFSKGISAFGDHKNCSIQASDVNRDGKTLTIADLDFLIRIVVGDLKPGIVRPMRRSTRILYYSGTGIASYHSFYSTSAIMLKFAGRQDAELLSTYARMLSSFDGDTTRIIFLPTGTEIPLGELVRFSSIPDTIIAEAGTVQGAYLAVEVLRDLLTDVDNSTDELLPGEFSLAQNYPNPFNPTTEISFSLPAVSDATLDIFNINGRLVRQLVDRRMQAGAHVVFWDGCDGQGRSVASGMYLYRLTAGENRQTRKMLLLK